MRRMSRSRLAVWAEYSPANCAWILTFFFLCSVLSRGITLYFSQLDLYVPTRFVFYPMLSLTFFLAVCQPVRELFAHSFLLDVCYCLLPATLLFTLVFMQYHFWLGAALALTAVAAGAVISALTLKGERASYRKKCAVAARALLAAATALFLLPVLIAIFRYDMQPPHYRAEESALASDAAPTREDRRSRQEMLDANPQVRTGLRQSAWEQMDMQERVNLLQLVADIEAAYLGIPSIPVSAEKLEPYTLGTYWSRARRLAIDTEHLGFSKPEDCVRTVAHEVFHAYQDYLAENIDWNSAVTDSAYFDEALRWKKNGEDYLRGEGYYEQPLEVSARDYSDAAVLVYFSPG